MNKEVFYIAGIGFFLSLWFFSYGIWHNDNFAIINGGILALTNLAILLGNK